MNDDISSDKVRMKRSQVSAKQTAKLNLTTIPYPSVCPKSLAPKNLCRTPRAYRLGSAPGGPNTYSRTRFLSHPLRLAKDISTNYHGMVFSTPARLVGLEQDHGLPPDSEAAIPAA